MKTSYQLDLEYKYIRCDKCECRLKPIRGIIHNLPNIILPKRFKKQLWSPHLYECPECGMLFDIIKVEAGHEVWDDFLSYHKQVITHTEPSPQWLFIPETEEILGRYRKILWQAFEKRQECNSLADIKAKGVTDAGIKLSKSQWDELYWYAQKNCKELQDLYSLREKVRCEIVLICRNVKCLPIPVGSPREYSPEDIKILEGLGL